MDIRFRNHKKHVPMIFPTRHSGFDTYELYTTLIDKDFKILNTCSQVVVHIIRELADSKLIPFDIMEYSKALQEAYDNLKDIWLEKKIPAVPGKYLLNTHCTVYSTKTIIVIYQ